MIGYMVQDKAVKTAPSTAPQTLMRTLHAKPVLTGAAATLVDDGEIFAVVESTDDTLFVVAPTTETTALEANVAEGVTERVELDQSVVGEDSQQLVHIVPVHTSSHLL